jgi:hypothetical protein
VPLGYALPTPRGFTALGSRWQRISAAMAGLAWALVTTDLALFLLSWFPGSQAEKMLFLGVGCLAAVASVCGTVAGTISLRNRGGGWLWFILNAALLLLLLSLILTLIFVAITDHPRSLGFGDGAG